MYLLNQSKIGDEEQIGRGDTQFNKVGVTLGEGTVLGPGFQGGTAMPHLSGLGQDCNSHGAGVDAALLLRLWHSLYSVHTSFKLHVLIGF